MGAGRKILTAKKGGRVYGIRVLEDVGELGSFAPVVMNIKNVVRRKKEGGKVSHKVSDLMS